jgi:hypothetical protein
VYWKGSLRKLKSIRAGYPHQPFIYDPDNPHMISSDINHLGQRGFLFRMLNAHGKYDTADPLDGKTKFAGFPNWPTVHWEDWKPIAGENAWVMIAALHLYHQKYFDTGAQRYRHNFKAKELQLAEELARAAMVLQADNGGLRMAPLGTYHHLLNINGEASLSNIQSQLDAQAQSKHLISPLTKFLEADFHYDQVSEEFKWHYFEQSTENNLSWYTAFKMLYTVTEKSVYRDAMTKIESYLKGVWNPEGHYFYQGMHFTDGEWIANTGHFATDVQTWGISKLGPQKIDEWFGEGDAYKMWEKTLALSGTYTADGYLAGVGFTAETGRISIEWTAGAIFATRALSAYYKDSRPDWSRQTLGQAITMRTRIDEYRFELSEQEAAYSYSSRRGWIPFGWFSHDKHVLSLVSTCWVILLDLNFNPFHLNGTG